MARSSFIIILLFPILCNAEAHVHGYSLENGKQIDPSEKPIVNRYELDNDSKYTETDLQMYNNELNKEDKIYNSLDDSDHTRSND